MRIALITGQYPGAGAAFAGGVATWAARLAGLLHDAGHDIEVFVPSFEPGVREHDGVRVDHVPMDRARLELLCRIGRWRLSSTMQALYGAWVIRAHVLARHAQKPFDLVQATSSSVPGLFLSLTRQLPICVFCSDSENAWLAGHGRELLSFDDRLLMWLSRHTCAIAHGAHAPSRFRALANHAQNDKIRVIRPPFVTSGTTALDSQLVDRLPFPYLLYFGVFNAIKGFDRIVDATAVFLRRVPDGRLVLVGRHAAFSKGRTSAAMVDALRGEFGDRVVCHEAVPQAALFPVIRRAHGVLFASRSDNFPNALQEAMALGTVVLGPRDASFDELLVDGENGLLFNPEEPQALAAAMERLWRLDTAERDRLTANAARSIAALAPDRTLPALVAYYDEVIAAWRAGR